MAVNWEDPATWRRFNYVRFPGSSIWHTLRVSERGRLYTLCGRETGPWDNGSMLPFKDGRQCEVCQTVKVPDA